MSYIGLTMVAVFNLVAQFKSSECVECTKSEILILLDKPA